MSNLVDLSIKIIYGNIKKYLLFFICNVCAIAMFMSILSLCHNTSLYQLDSIVSSNVNAPMYLMGLFLCFFIPYTQKLFQIQIQKDYAVLLSIGMNNREMTKCLVAGNSLLFFFCTIVGIVFGECLELMLIKIVNLIIGSSLEFQFNIKDIKFIFVYAIILFVVSMFWGLLRIRNNNIYEQLIYFRVSEEKRDNPLAIVVGTFISLGAIFLVFVFYKENSNIAIISIILLLIGIYIILGNCRNFIDKKRGDNIFWSSDWIYYYKRNRKIVFAACVLYFCIMYLLTMAAVTFPNFTNNALLYHPFDIAFSLSDNSDWIPDKKYMKDISNSQQVDITECVSMKYINIGAYSVFDINEVNRILKRNYQCDNDEAIYVLCIIENDGYEHNMSNIPKSIQLDDLQLNVSQVKCDVLFGNGCGTTDDVVLVDHELFTELISGKVLQTIYAYNFSDFRKTKYIQQNLLKDLHSMNHWENGIYPYISSKILAYENAKHSSEFLLILLLYDSLLIIFSVYIIIRYKFGIEFENDKKRFYILYSLGCDKKNIRKIIIEKVYSIFFIPYIIASIIILLFSYGTNYTYGYGRIGIFFGIGVILLIMLTILIIAYIFSYKLFEKINKDIFH